MENKMELNVTTINMKNILDKISKIISFKAKQKNLQLNICNNFSSLVLSDERRLTQVILNLSMNAIKYTIDGGVNIVVSEDSEKKEVIIQVKDTGIGIKPDKLEKIFTLFADIDGKEERKETGIQMLLKLFRNLLWIILVQAFS